MFNKLILKIQYRNGRFRFSTMLRVIPVKQNKITRFLLGESTYNGYAGFLWPVSPLKRFKA